MTYKLTVQDVWVLHNYFANKVDPTDADKVRVERLDAILADIVDGLEKKPTMMAIDEIFEKLTGEKLENYK